MSHPPYGPPDQPGAEEPANPGAPPGYGNPPPPYGYPPPAYGYPPPPAYGYPPPAYGGGSTPPPPGPPPNQPGGDKPPSNRNLILGLSAGLVVLLVATIGVVAAVNRSGSQTVGSPAPGPSASVPSASASTATSASSTPTPPEPTGAKPTTTKPSPTSKPKPQPKMPLRGLQKNSVYGINVVTSSSTCTVRMRRARPPLKNSQLAPYGRQLVGCMVKSFRTPLAKAGFTLTTPKVKSYQGSVKTPCGTLTSKGSPAYYCGVPRTIYWPVNSDDGYQSFTFARLGYVELVSHEFGHHIQQTTGILGWYNYEYYRVKSPQARYLLSRRLELQAQCFEGVFLGSVQKSIQLSDNDKAQLRLVHSYTGDEDPPASRKPDHGTSKAQVRWLFRGLDSTDFGKCNTWTASKAAVK